MLPGAGRRRAGDRHPSFAPWACPGSARGVPYLLATGYGSAGPLEGRDAGAVAVLRKPYQRAALAEALARALPGHAQGANEG